MPQIRHQQSELLPMEGCVRRYTTPTLDAIRQKRRIEQNLAPKTHIQAQALPIITRQFQSKTEGR